MRLPDAVYFPLIAIAIASAAVIAVIVAVAALALIALAVPAWLPGVIAYNWRGK